MSVRPMSPKTEIIDQITKLRREQRCFDTEQKMNQLTGRFLDLVIQKAQFVPIERCIDVGAKEEAKGMLDDFFDNRYVKLELDDDSDLARLAKAHTTDPKEQKALIKNWIEGIEKGRKEAALSIQEDARKEKELNDALDRLVSDAHLFKHKKDNEGSHCCTIL